MEARAGFSIAGVRQNLLRSKRDAPGALASARAAPNKLTTNLTLSSAERRRFAARTGATTSAAREQELTGPSMTGFGTKRKTLFRGPVGPAETPKKPRNIEHS